MSGHRLHSPPQGGRKDSASASGGCQCGAVRYRLNSEILDPHLCHCRMCQKAAGNYFMPLGSVKHAAFEITRGEPTWFHSSDPVRRGFCANCGTPLFLETLGGGKMYFTLGSLDEPGEIKPVSSYGSEAQYEWVGEISGRVGPATEDDEEVDGQPLERIRTTNHQHPDHETQNWPQAAGTEKKS